MNNKLEYYCVPISGFTELRLPFEVFDCDTFTVQLKRFTEEDLIRGFRLKYEHNPDTKSYRPIGTNPQEELVDEAMAYELHDKKLQFTVVPKVSTLDQTVRERLSLALAVVLGISDEYSTWVYEGFSTISSRGNSRSHNSAYLIQSITEEEISKINTILSYKESQTLKPKRFKALCALLNAARHQSGSSDVACVLYISVLEAIFVNSSQELAYTLSMRLTKYMQKDLEYSRKIKSLYTKRGKVIHGSDKGNTFTQEEYHEIEKLARDAFIGLVSQPELFIDDALDGRLLACAKKTRA